MGDIGLKFSTHVILVTFLIGIGITYTGALLINKEKSEYGPWLSVTGFESKEKLFSPGPLGYEIAVGLKRPSEWVRVRFYSLDRKGFPLYASADFKLIRIDIELIKVVEQKSREVERVPSYGITWEVRLPDEAPARYIFGVAIRDEGRNVIDKLISTLKVPVQKLNATMTLYKDEYKREEKPVLTITNHGPTQITFGEAYKIEKLVDSKGVEVPPNEGWIAVAYVLYPGDSYTQSINLTRLQLGDYRASKSVSAVGTYISKVLTAEFEIVQEDA